MSVVPLLPGDPLWIVVGWKNERMGRRTGNAVENSSSIIIELQWWQWAWLTSHCRDQLGQSKQSRASQQGQMFCSPCQIWSQDTPFISFVTLVSKNFAAYLRFLKWKPFLAFHFPVTMGFEMLKPHNYDARVTINLDIAWLRLIQLPPPPLWAAIRCRRRRTSWGSFTVRIVRDSYHTQLASG